MQGDSLESARDDIRADLKLLLLDFVQHEVTLDQLECTTRPRTGIRAGALNLLRRLVTATLLLQL